MRITYDEEEPPKSEETKEPGLEDMHESDLTARQRRQLEFKRLKHMTWGERVRYFWDYYKWVLVVLVIAIIAISEGISIYHNLQKKTVLSLAVMDALIGSGDQADRLCRDLIEVIGSGDPHEEVNIDTALISGDSVAAISKLTVVTASGMTDVVFLNDESWEDLNSRGAFLEWKEVLGVRYNHLSRMFDEEGRLDISKNERYKSYGLTMYEPVYCSLLAASEHKEAAARMVEFFGQAP